MTVEWKDDPSPLHLFEKGESAIVGKWRLHIDKMKEIKTDGMLGSLLSDLTEKETKVLRTRFGIDGNPIGETDSYLEKREKRKIWRETHPYQWRVDFDDKDEPEPFSFMGGSARTAEEGKALAEAAVGYAEMIYHAIRQIQS